MELNSRAVIYAKRFRCWLNQPQLASNRWFGKHCVIAAWLGLLLAAVSPPHGSGVTLCWLKSVTGLPCPGCGMTRSLSCGIRGMFSESLHYHPMGLFILALFILIAAQSLCTRGFRERVARFMENQATFFNHLYFAFVLTFMGFGIVRALFSFGGALVASK